MPAYGDKNSEQISMLFHSMVESNSPHEFQFTARSLQHQLILNRDDSVDTFDCAHPKWFDEEAIQVDDTICRFCGYGADCSRKQKDHVQILNIVSLDENPMPPRKYVEKCFQAIDSINKNKKFDPFLGFSLQAGLPRNLYMISQLNFQRKAPDKSPYFKQETAVGYDVKSQQSIWPLDQLFLEILLSKEGMKSVKKTLSGVSNLTPASSVLYARDQVTMVKMAKELGWLLDGDDESLQDGLYTIVSRFAWVLNQCVIGVGNSANRHFRYLSLESVSPLVDYPSIHGGSVLLNIVMRWLQIEPGLLQLYIGQGTRMKDDDREQQIVISERI